mmetsp:Transcript_5474/g.16721  ORF Transcript_5474/g.16721 Transcript_5474/m.16721 type:complete len:210 (-) Transcript_5474:806-1435(-)
MSACSCACCFSNAVSKNEASTADPLRCRSDTITPRFHNRRSTAKDCSSHSNCDFLRLLSSIACATSAFSGEVGRVTGMASSVVRDPDRPKSSGVSGLESRECDNADGGRSSVVSESRRFCVEALRSRKKRESALERACRRAVTVDSQSVVPRKREAERTISSCCSARAGGIESFWVAIVAVVVVVVVVVVVAAAAAVGSMDPGVAVDSC